MVWVKICGIRDRSALTAASDAGADAVGFVLAPESPRMVSIDDATALRAETSLPAFLVTVDATVDEALTALDITGAAGVQPHGLHGLDVSAAAIDLGRRALVPVPVGEDGPTVDLSDLPDGAIPLLDTHSSMVHGGTGLSFDWRLASAIRPPFVLAGGLGVDNVADAIRIVSPYGIDASSRLETAPGVKDPDTIRAFISEARNA